MMTVYTVVRCAVGVIDGGVQGDGGLHQGSALSRCVFAIVMDRMADEIRQDAPWTIIFVNGIVIYSESKDTQ